MEPVGLMGKSPDFVGTLSGLMGLKQQQQQLKQQTLETNQQQSVQDFYKDFDPTSVTGTDGSYDLNKVFADPKFKSAGNAKPVIANQIIEAKQKQLQATSALAQLNGQLVEQFGTGLGALVNDQDIKDDKTDPATGINPGREKVAEFMRQFAGIDPAHAKIGGMYGLIANHAPIGKLSDGLRVLQLQAQSASEQQAQQNPATGSVNVGPKVIATNTNKATGQVTESGKEFTIAPGPTETPDYKAKTAAALGAAQGVTQRVQHAQAAANGTIQAQDALSRSLEILDSPSIDTGAAFDKLRGLKNVMASIGIDTDAATDANSLVKNLARYEAARATQAGLGGTDAARELAHNGSPNTTVDKGALKGVIKQSLATEKAVAAYARIQAKTTDPAQMQKNESDFQSIPNAIIGYEYGMSKSPQEADAFLKKHGLTKEQMKQTRDAIKAFEAR